jgi:hypothetical protein
LHVIFSHFPASSEVLLNIPALWDNTSFQAAAEHFRERNGNNSDALFHVRSRQSEVILRADLRYEELTHLCGLSSPFDGLCEIHGSHSEEERDRLWQDFVEADNFPEEAFYLSPEGTKAVMGRAYAIFFEKHGSTIQAVLDQRG